MTFESLRRIINSQRYGSSLIAVSLSTACHPAWTCDMTGTCARDGEEAGVSTETSTESTVSTTEEPTSSDGTSVETLSDAASESSLATDTGTSGAPGTSTSEPTAACLPVSDDGCSGSTPWCLGEGETDGGTLQEPRCVECEEDTHCQWPLVPRDEGGVCLNYVCTPCELGTNRGCEEDAPYCVASNIGSSDADASVGPLTESDGGTNPDTVKCAECLTESDCGGATPACVNNSCVACDRDEQCGDVNASRCDLDTNTCAPCNAEGQCAHLSDTPACDVSGGTCVECTRDEQTKCDGPNLTTTLDDRVCVTITSDPRYQTCGETYRGQGDQCTECESDVGCASGYACVPETFKVPSSDAGVEETGKYYCMRLQSSLGEGRQCDPNNRPFVGWVDTTSEGGTATRYCRPQFTTCAGYGDWRTGPDIIPEDQTGAGQATCFSNDSCGLPGVDDGYCAVANPNTTPPTNLCTYECGADLDCKGNVICNFDSPPSGLLSGNGVCAVTSNPL